MAGSTYEPWSNPPIGSEQEDLTLISRDIPEPPIPLSNPGAVGKYISSEYQKKLRENWETTTGLKWDIGQPEGFVPTWNQNTQKWEWKGWVPERNSYDTWDEASKKIVSGPTQLAPLGSPQVIYETWDKTSGKSTPKIPESTSPTTTTATPSAYVPLPNYQTAPMTSPFSQNFASTASTLPQYQPLPPYYFPSPKVFWDF